MLHLPPSESLALELEKFDKLSDYFIEKSARQELEIQQLKLENELLRKLITDKEVI